MNFIRLGSRLVNRAHIVRVTFEQKHRHWTGNIYINDPHTSDAFHSLMLFPWEKQDIVAMFDDFMNNSSLGYKSGQDLQKQFQQYLDEDRLRTQRYANAS
jgi:hypothetical protein